MIPLCDRCVLIYLNPNNVFHISYRTIEIPVATIVNIMAPQVDRGVFAYPGVWVTVC